MLVPIAAVATNEPGVQQETTATTTAPAPARQSSVPWGCTNPRGDSSAGGAERGCRRGAADGLFGSRSPTATRRSQEARATPWRIYFDDTAAQFLREAAEAPAASHAAFWLTDNREART